MIVTVGSNPHRLSAGKQAARLTSQLRRIPLPIGYLTNALLEKPIAVRPRVDVEILAVLLVRLLDTARDPTPVPIDDLLVRREPIVPLAPLILVAPLDLPPLIAPRVALLHTFRPRNAILALLKLLLLLDTYRPLDLIRPAFVLLSNRLLALRASLLIPLAPLLGAPLPIGEAFNRQIATFNVVIVVSLMEPVTTSAIPPPTTPSLFSPLLLHSQGA